MSKEYLTVKQLPDSEKPYEKFLMYGAGVLSDAELIAVIIRSGTSGLKSVEVAQKILNCKCKSLLNLYEMSFEELLDIRGIGTVKAIQLKCIAELSKRIASETYRRDIRLNDAASVADYYMEQMRHEKQEKVIVCMFDAKSRLITDALVTVGGISTSMISPREIFRKALEHQAANIILLHNHPSGFPEPSAQDDEVTELVGKCGTMLGIRLMDHIIIGDKKYYSYREHMRL